MCCLWTGHHNLWHELWRWPSPEPILVRCTYYVTPVRSSPPCRWGRQVTTGCNIWSNLISLSLLHVVAIWVRREAAETVLLPARQAILSNIRGYRRSQSIPIILGLCPSQSISIILVNHRALYQTECISYTKWWCKAFSWIDTRPLHIIHIPYIETGHVCRICLEAILAHHCWHFLSTYLIASSFHGRWI